MPKRNESPVLDQKQAAIKRLRTELQLGKSRKGGLALATKSTRDFILERGSKGGCNTRDLYGREFYSWASQRRKIKLGWPKGKLRKRKAQEAALQTIHSLDLKPSTAQMFEAMIRVVG